jgi:hypothetical protein
MKNVHDTDRRRTHILIGIALAGFGISTILMRRVSEAKSNDAANFVLAGERATSTALGLSLQVPATWTRLVIPAQAGVDFAVQDATGIRFAAQGYAPEASAKVEPTLQLMLDNKRKQHGELRDVQWGDESIATLKARTLTFTIAQTPNGPARTKVWTLVRGPYWASFHCGGPEPVFAAQGEKLCRQLLDRIKLQTP